MLSAALLFFNSIPSAIRFAVIGIVTGIAFGVTTTAHYLHGQQAEAALVIERKSAAAMIQADAKLRAAEQAAATQLYDVSTHYQQELARVKTEQDGIITNLRTGAVRLRIPVTHCGAAAPDPTAATATGRDGGETAELPLAAAEFLTALASDADATVAQLTACQQVVLADRAALH